MRRLQARQPQLKRELFAMKLYARTGRTRCPSQPSQGRFANRPRRDRPVPRTASHLRTAPSGSGGYVASPPRRKQIECDGARLQSLGQAAQRKPFSTGWRARRSTKWRANELILAPAGRLTHGGQIALSELGAFELSSAGVPPALSS